MKKYAVLLILLILISAVDVQAASYPEWRPDPPMPERPHLTKTDGTFLGVNGVETYYNLNMSKIITKMRGLGYDAETYPYYIREDGAKMLGEYVMCAADYDIRPVGTVLETSLGYALVCDTGAFAFGKVTTQIDLATDW